MTRVFSTKSVSFQSSGKHPLGENEAERRNGWLSALQERFSEASSFSEDDLAYFTEQTDAGRERQTNLHLRALKNGKSSLFLSKALAQTQKKRTPPAP